MTPAPPPGWELRHLRAPAAELHALAVPEPARRSVWVLQATAPALVLGSTQGDDLVDAEAAAALGVDVVRRRSGGGTVLVDPVETAWVDVVVPAGDPLWDDDVGRSALWLGRAWQAALADLGTTGTEVHTGALACGSLGRLVCFATVGAGEVTVGPDDRRKLVGISQRRTRAGSRFQCAVPTVWSPAELVRLLRAHPSVGELPTVATLPSEQAEELPAALTRSLLR